MLEGCRVSLEHYIVELRARGLTERADHLLQEVRARLRQLQWLYTRLLHLEHELEEEERKTLPPPGPDRVKLVFREVPAARADPRIQSARPVEKPDELQVLLEAFYYSAHRVRDILHDHESDLPGVKEFEAKGVRDVRNHLVEHPSRAKGVLVYSIACGGPVGPQLRLLRWSLDPPGTVDRGLNHNARELERALSECLCRAISAIGKSPA